MVIKGHASSPDIYLFRSFVLAHERSDWNKNRRQRAIQGFGNHIIYDSQEGWQSPSLCLVYDRTHSGEPSRNGSIPFERKSPFDGIARRYQDWPKYLKPQVTEDTRGIEPASIRLLHLSLAPTEDLQSILSPSFPRPSSKIGNLWNLRV